MDVGAVGEAIQIGVLVLISISCVLAILLVWWDDHTWVDVRRL
jgi:hypothetical protein